jgi:DNA-binding transcriptional ArsR family regulator
MVLTELEQIKVLADPLRIRILEELCEERTTKQVAKLLGEKPTKLYHHVEALERVGLVALTRTRPNRGTTEKYYQAVARTFRAAPSAFSAGTSPEEEARAYRDMVQTIFDSTSAELGRLIDQGAAETLEGKGLLSFVEIRAGEEDIAEIRRRLTEAVEVLTALASDSRVGGAGADLPHYRLTIAFYPLEVAPLDASRRASRRKESMGGAPKDSPSRPAR